MAHAVMPIITVDDLEGVVAFYRDTLGFNVDFRLSTQDDQLFMSSVSLGGAPIMFTQAMPGTPSPTALNPDGLALFVSVDDVDAYHDKVAGNVEVVEGLTDQFWGDRTFIVKDPSGLHVWFGTTTGEMQEPPGGLKVEMTQPIG